MGRGGDGEEVESCLGGGEGETGRRKPCSPGAGGWEAWLLLVRWKPWEPWVPGLGEVRAGKCIDLLRPLLLLHVD